MEAGAITVRTVAVFLLATWPRRLVLGLILLIPCIVITLGGLRPAPPIEYDIAAGETVDTGPLTVRPTAFFVSDEVQRSTLGYHDGAVAWVGVVVEVDNVTTEQIPLDFPGAASDAVVPVLDDGVLIDTGSSVPDVVLRLADATSSPRVLPGVPSELVLLWPLSDADAVGDELVVTLTEQEWVYRVLSGEEGWLSLGERWRMELPRIDLPEILYEPEEDF